MPNFMDYATTENPILGKASAIISEGVAESKLIKDLLSQNQSIENSQHRHGILLTLCCLEVSDNHT